MPASKKKAQLDPAVRKSIALLWAYNGDDIVLLTFLPAEQRFDEYCQSKRKGFPQLTLGTWFSIEYQRYVKCNARVNVLNASMLNEAPFRTRVENAFVQLCVPFICTNSNPFANEYTYKSSLGNILLKKEVGAGPKHLLIWCSLNTTAWWNSPIFEKIETVYEVAEEARECETSGGGERMNSNKTTPLKHQHKAVENLTNQRMMMNGTIDMNGTTTNGEEEMAKHRGIDEKASSSQMVQQKLMQNDLGISLAHSIKTNYYSNQPMISNALPTALISEQIDDDLMSVDPDFAGNGQNDVKNSEEEQKSAKEAEIIIRINGEQRNRQTEGGGRTISASRRNGRKDNNYHYSIIDEPVGRKKQLEETDDTQMAELASTFDWTNLAVGIVVARTAQTNSTDRIGRARHSAPTHLYHVFPLCTNERFPGELRLKSRHTLKIGQWICYTRSTVTFGDLDDGEFRCQLPMLRTLPVLGTIVIECEIVFPMRKGGEIRTTSPLVPQEQGLPPLTPFIAHIGDDLGLLVTDWPLLGTRRWATLQYTRMDWSDTKSYWNIVHIRPAGFGFQNSFFHSHLPIFDAAILVITVFLFFIVVLSIYNTLFSLK